MRGGDGNDFLCAGDGTNNLDGQAGADIFCLEDISTKIDNIYNFEVGTDKLLLPTGVTYGDLTIVITPQHTEITTPNGGFTKLWWATGVPESDYLSALP